jgi:cytochrome P450
MSERAVTAIDFDPTRPEQQENPFDVLELARREQPVFFAPAFGLWVVTRHEDVLTVLKDHATFSSVGALKSAPGPYPPEVLEVLAGGWPEMPYIIEVDPPLHDRIRGLVTKAFTPRRIQELRPRIAEIAHELLEGFADAGSCDMVERFAWPLPLRVLGELFGVPRDDLEQLHHWGTGWLLLQQELPLDERVEHGRSLVSLQHYFVDAVRARSERPTNDLLGALVAARGQIEPPLSDVEIAGLPLDLMVAGHVTVTRAIGSTLHRMFSYPPLREHLLDAELAPKAIEEILRLESPAQGLFRITTRETELGGATLPEGARVMAHFASANRDACVFAHPDEYDPQRDDIKEHLAFGKGIHFCIGAPLGRLELGVALPILLERLPNLRAGAGTPVRESVFFARGFRSLPVAWDA